MKVIDETSKKLQVDVQKKYRRRPEVLTVSVRIPLNMLYEIDDVVATRIGLNRHAWILEALQEKLTRKTLDKQILDVQNMRRFKPGIATIFVFKITKLLLTYNPLR